MKIAADICVVPMGVGASVSEYVAEAYQVLADAGLDARLHAHGTNIEGEYEAVMAAVKRCHERLHALGAPRILTTLKIGSRIDKEQTTDDKIEAVRRRLKDGLKDP